jgi:hypothetical protein
MSKLQKTVFAAVTVAALAGPTAIASAAGKPSAHTLPVKHRTTVHHIAAAAVVASCYAGLPAAQRAQLVGMPCP